MSSNLAQRVNEVISSQTYATIATVSGDGAPWNTPVYTAHDQKLSFFWSSWIHAEHSKNIRNNPSVFMVLFDSSRKRGDNHQRGVYIKANATELVEAGDIEHALKYFTGVGGKQLGVGDFTGDSQKRLYRAIPERVWLNDVSESQVTRETLKMRVEVALGELQA